MKMKTLAALMLAGAGILAAQIQPKSKGEYDAIMAIQNAATPDDRIKAVDALLTKYADTQFKPMALETAAASAQQKNDLDTMIIYAERALEANPKSYTSMFMLAQAWAARTKEFDLDKEDKLQRAEKYAKEGMATVATAAKPNPQIPDAQWEAVKKDLTSQGHEALGMVALLRKKNDVAIAEYKNAVEGANTPDPATMVRLAGAYAADQKYDAAIATLDRVLAIPDAHPTVKQVAQNQKAQYMKAKAAGAPKPAAPQAGVPQVEIKK